MAVKIFALVSTYKEREIIHSCVNSGLSLDRLIIFEGRTNATEETSFKEIGSGSAVQEFRSFLISGILKVKSLSLPSAWLTTVVGAWKSDADKRTDMLAYAQAIDKDAWILWLDGDEILLYGEYLKDHCQRADNETATGGTTIRLVEYDGSVAQCYGKLIKAKNVKRYVMSSYEVELTNGMTVALPNVPICTAGGIPFVNDGIAITQSDDYRLPFLRPPLIGEPHLLHRHGLRDPKRQAERLHDTEADSFSELVKEAGLEGVDKQTAERK